MKRKLSLLLALLLAFAAVPVNQAVADTPEAAFDACAPVQFDEEGRIVLSGGEIAGEIKSYFGDPRSVKAYDFAGNELSATDTAASGATFVAGDSDTEISAVLYGDVNGDGSVSTRDIAMTMNSIVGSADIFEPAADVTRDGRINAKDVALMMQYAAGWDVTITPEKEIEIADAEDEAVDVYFESLMHQVAMNDTAVYGERTGLIRLAKNEQEDAQIIFTSTEKKTDLTLEVGAPVNENGAELRFDVHYGYYYDMTKFTLLRGIDLANTVDGYFVDPMPYLPDGEAFTIGANESKAFYVTVYSDEKTESGYYKAPVILKNAEGEEIKKAELYVYVWDFTLDVRPASDTAFGLSKGAVWERHYNFDYNALNAATEDERIDVYRMYYDFLLENHISSYGLPYRIDDSRADAYMSDPRVTSFIVSGAGNGGQYDVSDADTKRFYEKLRTNPDWLDKGYIYKIDEPCGDGYDMVRDQWIWASELIPEMDFQVVVPFATNEYMTKLGIDAVEYVTGYLNIWCPQTYAFTTYATLEMRRENPILYPSYANSFMKAQNFRVYQKQFIERYEELREQGNKMWWYVCISPQPPYANFFTSYQGIDVRILLWQQYMNDIDGLLYWATVAWEGVNHKRVSNGDGMLLYWGELFGSKGPVPSVRLYEVRDGLEDFQYLTQLERLTDRANSMKYVDRLTQGMLTFTEDHLELEDARYELGFELEAFGD